MAFRGDRLYKLRQQKGFSQEDLADQVGASQTMIGRYESGKVDPTADVVTRLAQFFEVTTDYLLGLTDNPFTQITEDDLSPMEKRLIAAFRAGRIVEALSVAAELAKAQE